MMCGEMKVKISDFHFHFTTHHGKQDLSVLVKILRQLYFLRKHREITMTLALDAIMALLLVILYNAYLRPLPRLFENKPVSCAHISGSDSQPGKSAPVDAIPAPPRV